MKEYGFAATVFINPGDVGTRLTWDQIREMHKNGITILIMGSNISKWANCLKLNK